MKHLILATFLLLLSTARFSLAQAPATRPTLFDPALHMRTSEVSPGMKGYGLSVFSGAGVERFEVEVISVLKNFNPAADVVLIRCSGANLEHTGAIAGMSGSPIYLTDLKGNSRMIGAFAYGWSLNKDPIAGVQPIEYMLEIPEPVAPPATGPSEGRALMSQRTRSDLRPAAERGRWSLDESIRFDASQGSARVVWRKNNVPQLLANRNASAYGAELRPLLTPLAMSGMTRLSAESLRPLFASLHMMPLQAGGAGDLADENLKFEPGGVLALPLLTGDLDMTAIGTVTEVIGQRIFGFGHPFNAEGPVDLPMAPGRIATCIASIAMSFKLGSGAAIQGTLNGDELTGVSGRIGDSPKMIPIEFRLVYSDGSVDKVYRFESAAHPKFTPALVGAALQAALTGARDLPQHHTIEYDMAIDFGDGRTIRSKDVAVDVGVEQLFYEVGTPLLVGAENPFERVLPTQVRGTIRVTPEARVATVLTVNIPKLKVRPGEAIRGYVTYRPFQQAEAILPIAVQLPADLPDGQYQLVVGDWMRYINDERAAQPFRFTAENIDEVFAVLADFASIKRQALYVRLVRQPDGVAVGRTAMPKLPSSRRAVLMGAGRSDVTPFVSSAITVLPTDFVMNGSADFVITVDKNARVDPQ